MPVIDQSTSSPYPPLRCSTSFVSVVTDGTRLRYRLAADSGLGGALGRAMEPLIEKAQANGVKAKLATLVRLLEPQAA